MSKHNLNLTGTIVFLSLALFLSACARAAVPNTSAQQAAPPTAAVATPTLVPEKEAAQVLYPYYLPLVTKPDIAPQTIGNVTTSIDWVYVDESRVAIQYTLSGLDWPDGATMDAMSARVTSKDISGIGNGGSGASSSLADKGTITNYVDLLLMDGSLDAEEHPEILLSVDIPVSGPVSIVKTGAVPAEELGQVVEATPLEVGTFYFEFKVLVKRGIRLENVDQTMVANDVSMTLKSLVITSSRVEALICFQMPSAADWGLTASKVTMGGKDFSFSGGGLLPNADGKGFSWNDVERCSTVSYDIIYDESVASVTLTVPKLMSSMPEVVSKDRVEMANKRLESAGIQFDYINVDHGGDIELLKQPEGMSNYEIYSMIWEALSEQYDGPWVFTVDVKQ